VSVGFHLVSELQYRAITPGLVLIVLEERLLVRSRG
jgi:hypothetical protein